VLYSLIFLGGIKVVLSVASRGLLSPSLEDYLKAIFHIVSEKQAVRAKDIAGRLRVSSASVTGALRSLSKKGLINYAPYDVITLTAEGQKVTKDVIRRHKALRNFFGNVLLVGAEEADDGACKMEHALPGPILDRLIKFLEYAEVLCPLGGKQWLKGFEHYCETGHMEKGCPNCTLQARGQGC
jgi:DtxR family Mn-dependent transcriptional regulator